MNRQPHPQVRRLRFTTRKLIVSVLVLLALAIAWFVAALILFVLPKQQPLHRADAIVSLAPASMRLPAAMDAVEQGLAPLLWVSHFPKSTSSTGQGLSKATQVCNPDAPNASQTTCFTPTTDDTIGEARAVAKLVEQFGVTHLIVTTNTSHATRAKFIFERCLPPGTKVQMLLVDEPPGHGRLLQRLIYETGASGKAITEVSLCKQ